MRVLVVGNGGREHALCWAIRRDDPHAELFCAPGNPGTAAIAENIPIPASDIPGIIDVSRRLDVALVVVGPEAPLADGLADALMGASIPVFGPTAAAARIEASKAFAKEIMASNDVPTAGAEVVTSFEDAKAAIARSSEPLVVKASGLAGGKGAIVCDTRTDAVEAARAMAQDRRFGAAGDHILIEDFLVGEELSVFALTDGEHSIVLPAAQDHKRLLEGDAGPNTGGMGAYSPVSLATPEIIDRIRERVIDPTLAGLRAVGAPYRGVLYAGLMIDSAGAPAVVEFNCRFGDPEAQIVLPLTRGVLDVMRSIAEGGRVDEGSLEADQGAAVVTVLAAAGYPDAPRKGDSISIPSDLPTDVLIFHAGTSRSGTGDLCTSGGRVLSVVGLGRSVQHAADASRTAAESISFDGKQFRRDIGWRELARARTS